MVSLTSLKSQKPPTEAISKRYISRACNYTVGGYLVYTINDYFVYTVIDYFIYTIDACLMRFLLATSFYL